MISSPAGSATRGTGPSGIARVALICAAVVYVALLLIAPLGGIAWAVGQAGVDMIVGTLVMEDVQHAFVLTVVIAVIAVSVTTIFGVIAALVLARDRFPGRRLLSALVDLPLAVSPVIVGLMVVVLFGRSGWLEGFFAARGIQIIFALPSMVLVTIFICIPFVIREIAPVLEQLGTEEEDAARTLGASSFQAFARVTLPNIRWALLYGVALTSARALGEIGAVLIVSGQIQGHTETATLYIYRALEEREDASAFVVAVVLATVSIVMLAAIELFKRRQSARRTLA